MTRTITVGEGAAAGRLDVYLASKTIMTRSHVQKLLASKDIKVNGKSVKPGYALQVGDSIQIKTGEKPTKPHSELELPVVYEDKDILVIDKPAGILVHNGTTTTSKTAATVASFMRSRTTDADPDRPGIVHRLDRDTSGLLILAKSAQAKDYMQTEFRTRKIHKTYRLLVIGRPEPSAAEIHLPTGRHPGSPLKRSVVTSGRPAVTRYETLANFHGYSLIEAKPETGRTHQLRVHFAAIGHPVAGDTTYGPARRPLHLKRQFLHASELKFIAPSGRDIHLTSSLPDDLKTALADLSNQV